MKQFSYNLVTQTVRAMLRYKCVEREQVDRFAASLLDVCKLLSERDPESAGLCSRVSTAVAQALVSQAENEDGA